MESVTTLTERPPADPDMCPACHGDGTHPTRNPSIETVCPVCGGNGMSPACCPACCPACGGYGTHFDGCQPRERAVLCWRCLKNKTWRTDGMCEPCKQKAGM